MTVSGEPGRAASAPNAHAVGPPLRGMMVRWLGRWAQLMYYGGDYVDVVLIALLCLARGSSSTGEPARTVADLRDEGHVVFLHCVAGQSRTPTVAVTYAMLRGIDHDTAMRDVCAALPSADPNRAFRRVVRLAAERRRARFECS